MNSMAAHLERALLLYQQGRFDLAEAELRQHLLHDSEHPQALAYLALCLAGQKKLGPAEAAARQAVGRAPAAGITHFALAWVLHHRNKAAEAEQAITQALHFEPYEPDYYALLAQLRTERQNWKGALDAVETGLALDAEHVACNNLRAMALVHLGRKEEAGVTLKSTLQSNPENALTHANLGWACLHQGQAKDATQHFREALRLDAQQEWAQVGLVEAIKARFLPYRLLLQFFLWMSRFSDRTKLLILLGGFFGNQFLVQLQQQHPEWAWWIRPLTMLYFGFVLVTWFGVPLSNLVLMLHPFGRFAVQREAKRYALGVGLFLVGILAGYLAYVGTGNVIYEVLALTCFLLLFPLGGIYLSPAGWPRRVMVGVFTALVAMAVLAFFFMNRQENIALSLWKVCAYGCFLSTFLANFMGVQRVVRS